MEDNSLNSAGESDEDILAELGLGAWKGYPYKPLEISSVLVIDLSEEFRHVFGLLYAAKSSTERSERVLTLTTRAIKLNVGNPTAWMLRREVTTALAKSDSSSIWKKELAFTASIITKNGKNYQAWEHRRFAAESGNLLQAEIEFVDLILHEGEKNYHAWSHRQWLAKKHGIIEGELDATEWYIRTDVRNNSAWNHRWLVTGLVQDGRVESELNFAIDMLQDAARNESVWNYIHALGKSGLDITTAKQKALECLEVDAGCIPARRFLVLNGLPSEAEDIKRHCELLASGIDPVRKKYWKAQADTATGLTEDR